MSFCHLFIFYQVGSLSGSLVKHVKSWVRRFPVERLEFFAMHFPSEPWKKLADLCHLNPVKDFPQWPWFLSFCFGKPMPENVNTSTTPELAAENICEKIMTTDICIKPRSTSKDKNCKIYKTRYSFLVY